MKKTERYINPFHSDEGQRLENLIDEIGCVIDNFQHPTTMCPSLPSTLYKLRNYEKIYPFISNTPLEWYGASPHKEIDNFIIEKSDVIRDFIMKTLAEYKEENPKEVL